MIVRFMPSFRENTPATMCQLKKEQPKKGYFCSEGPKNRSSSYDTGIPR
jgi:hypothetical protein